MSVGVDAHIDPAGCNRKIARTVGENEKRFVGADASVRPLGIYGFAATFRKNGSASCRTDRVVRPYGCRPFRIGTPIFATLYRAGGVEPLPYAGLVDSARSPKGRANLQVPTAQSFSRLRRQHPYPLCPFGTFPPDRGNRPFAQGSLYGGAIWQCIQKGSRAAAASLFYRFRVLVLWSA